MNNKTTVWGSTPVGCIFLQFFSSIVFHYCPAAEDRGAFDIVRENVTRSVCLSLYLSLSLSVCLFVHSESTPTRIRNRLSSEWS